MAYIATTKHSHSGFGDRIATIVRAQRERLEQYRLYRRTVNELGSLSDRELSDLGISRSMIGPIAQEAAYGRA